MEGGVRRRGLAATPSGRGLLEGGDAGRRVLERFDLFPKVANEVALRTQSGGFVTVISLALVLVLVWSELAVFLRRDFSDRIAVDTTLHERLRINVDITFHALSCKQVELIAMDVTGENQIELEASVKKTAIANPTASAPAARKNKNECQSCYGAGDDGRCCNTCAELVEAYTEQGWDPSNVISTADQCKDMRDKSSDEILASIDGHHSEHGCQVAGAIFVNKVAGNFHVALGHGATVNGRLLHQFSPTQLPFFNTSHTINSLWFGDRMLPHGEGTSPLDGRRQVVDPHEAQTGAYQYHLEIVPTEYRSRRYYQFTVAESFTPVGHGDHDPSDKHAPHQGHGHAQPAIISSLPGVFFIYDLSPFVVRRTDLFTSPLEFVVHILAIAGGTFALSRFIDTFLFTVTCATSR